METLDEWAKRHGRSTRAVRNQLVSQPGFPASKGQRARSGRGIPAYEYDGSELDAWLADWEAAHRPAPVTAPEGTDLDTLRTLGAIAGLIGYSRKSVTQYRATFDEHAEHDDHGARRLYRTGDIIDLLNARLGRGRAVSTEDDRRRKTSAPVAEDDNDEHDDEHHDD